VRKYWRISRTEGLVWIITFLSTVFLEVDIGKILGTSLLFYPQRLSEGQYQRFKLYTTGASMD
jgi:hypothetical protein